MSYVCTGDGDANEPSRSHVLHGLCTLLPASAAPLRLPTCPALEVGASLDYLGHHPLYCWPSNEPCSGLIPHPRQVENFRSRSLDEKEVPFTTSLPARAPRPNPKRLPVLLKCNLANLECTFDRTFRPLPERRARSLRSTLWQEKCLQKCVSKFSAQNRRIGEGSVSRIRMAACGMPSPAQCMLHAPQRRRNSHGTQYRN
jgi:hypothetical protein